jgi:hypothetical protein
MNADVQFVNELPFPETNALIYRELYEYEQLFRRLAHAALVAKAGAEWESILPEGLLPKLQGRLENLSNRIYLNCENSRNPIWITTLEQLRTILTMESILPVVQEFSSYQKAFLVNKLSEVIEIRNVIGHNRATTLDTLTIWRGIAASLKPGMDAFKAILLYDQEDMVYLETEDHSNPVAAYYSQRCRALDQSGFQPLLSESKYFYSLTHLPVNTDGDWVRAAALLNAFENAAQYIFCFMINKSGNEFQVVLPKSLPKQVYEQIVDTFLQRSRQVWTHTPYQEQSAAYVCDPQIWFYENRRPCKE